MDAAVLTMVFWWVVSVLGFAVIGLALGVILPLSMDDRNFSWFANFAVSFVGWLLATWWFIFALSQSIITLVGIVRVLE